MTLPRSTAWALALTATSTMAVSYLDRQALAVLAPTITKALDINETQYGALQSAFSVAYLLFAPPAGRFIDAVGARRGLLASVLVWSVVSAAHALVPGFSTLFFLRILLGAAEAPSFPGAAQTVSRALPPADRNAGFGVLFTGSSLGAMIAPLVVTALEARYGWRAAMVGTAVVGLAWIPLWLGVTGTPAAREAMAASAPARGEPFRWRGLFGDRAIRRAVIAVVATAPTGAFALLWGSKILVGTYHLAQTDVRRYLWLPPVVYDAGSIAFGALATLRERRAGRERSTRPLFAAALLLGLLVALVPRTTTPWETTLVLSFAFAGVGGCYALITSEMLRRVGAPRVAAAAGCTAAAQSFAYIIANPLIGRAADHFHGYGEAAVCLALWTIPGCLAWLLAADDPRRSGEPARA